MSAEPVYDYLCSIGELIDKLTIENIKCYDANNKIILERARQTLDHRLISTLELKARLSGEQRVRLKNEVTIRIKEAVERGTMNQAAEVRTYGGKDA